MSQPRYEVEPGINNCLIIRDSHSSDLTSLTKHALTFLEQQSANSYVRRTLIVSDIDGNDLANEMFFVNIQKVIKSKSVNRIIFIGPELYSRVSLFSEMEDKLFFKNTKEFFYEDEAQEKILEKLGITIEGKGKMGALTLEQQVVIDNIVQDYLADFEIEWEEME